jgi:hypothetical protein
MNAEIFAEWLRRQRYHVVRTPSSYWYQAGSRVYQAFPYHWVIEPNEAELRKVLVENRAIALRHSTPVSAPHGKISYHVVYTQAEYDLEDLDRRSRQNIRRGLKNCHVESITLQQLAEEGWYLEVDTAERQNRQTEWEKTTWRKRCLAAADLPGFEAWGAFVNGKLVATLLVVQIDDWVEYISQQCLQGYLNDRVNNALCFTVTQAVLSRPNINNVFYTLQSLDAPPSVDEFKFRMGFTPRPVRQRVVFHPWFTTLVNSVFHKLVIQLQKRNASNRILTKADGIFRFYHSGNIPLNQQEWPKCLEPYREELI